MLDSLEAQTLKDIEFICINDGSTDSSLEIAQRYAARRRPIPDYRQKGTPGYGASMNCGMRAARGHYIGIVESDDFVSPDRIRGARRALSVRDARYCEG